MDILITGINGFIGRNIAKNLSKAGHRIIGVGTSKFSDLSKICKYHSVSVLDQEVINQLVNDADLVIHLAAITAHKEIIDNKFLKNINNSINNLLEKNAEILKLMPGSKLFFKNVKIKDEEKVMSLKNFLQILSKQI